MITWKNAHITNCNRW